MVWARGACIHWHVPKALFEKDWIFHHITINNDICATGTISNQANVTLFVY